MKFLTTTVCAVLLLFSLQEACAQCNSALFAEGAKDKLPQSFTFLKSYQIDGKGGAKPRIEFSYVFSKNSTYRIYINGEDGGANGIKATLLDANRRVKARSYANGRLYPAFNFDCPATGIYYIRFEFEGYSTYCGGAALGFKR